LSGVLAIRPTTTELTLTTYTTKQQKLPGKSDGLLLSVPTLRNSRKLSWLNKMETTEAVSIVIGAECEQRLVTECATFAACTAAYGPEFVYLFINYSRHLGQKGC